MKKTAGKQSKRLDQKNCLVSVEKAAVRRKQLLTMAPIKVTIKRLSQQQKEQRDTNKYQRRRLAW